MRQPLMQLPLGAADTIRDTVFNRLKEGEFAGIEWSGSLEEVIDAKKSQAWRCACEMRTELESAFLVNHFDDGHLGDDDDAARRDAIEDVKRLLRVARETNVSRISVIPAVVGQNMPRNVTYQNALNRVHDALPILGREAERCGVTLCVCAAQQGFLMSPPELRELIDSTCSSSLGVDVNISDRCDQADWCDWIATLGPRVGAIGISRTDAADLICDVAQYCELADASGARVVLR